MNALRKVCIIRVLGYRQELCMSSEADERRVFQRTRPRLQKALTIKMLIRFRQASLRCKIRGFVSDNFVLKFERTATLNRVRSNVHMSRASVLSPHPSIKSLKQAAVLA